MQEVAVTADQSWLSWLCWVLDYQRLCVEGKNLALILQISYDIHKWLPEREDGVTFAGTKMSVLQPGVESPYCRQESPGHASGVDRESRQYFKLILVFSPFPEVGEILPVGGFAHPVEMGEETGDDDGAGAQVESQTLDLRVDQGLKVSKGPPLYTPHQHTILVNSPHRREEFVREADDPCLPLQLVEPPGHGARVAQVSFISTGCHNGVRKLGECMLVAGEKVGTSICARISHQIRAADRYKRRLGGDLSAIDDIKMEVALVVGIC